MSSLPAEPGGPRAALAFYFHLPSIATGVEVREHARGNLRLLLRLHRDAGAPVLVAPTGSFLTLCQAHAPDVVDDLAQAMADDTAVIGATFFHEIEPFSVRWRDVGDQLARDVEVKTELFGRTPRWFYPPNFAWHPALGRALATHGIDGAVLDCRHLASAATARSWAWAPDAVGGVQSRDTPAFVEPWEHRRLRIAIAASAAPPLRVMFRDWPLTRELTFGNTSAIHVPDAPVESTLGELAPGEIVTLADDGDRVRASSRRGYERLLRAGIEPADWTVLLDEPSPLPPVRELPAFSLPGFDELLRTSLDARAYWSLIAELGDLDLDDDEHETFLALQDVFYPFWKGCGRRSWYVDTALDLLESKRASAWPG